jgi:microcystin-dependent protein
MADAYLGQILSVGFNYAPYGWYTCEGQQLAVRQNQALFALVGVVYGGDGVNSFMLPDLRSRRMVGASLGSGAAPTTSTYQLGQKGGSVGGTIPICQHTHQAAASTSGLPASVTIPSTNVSLAINNASVALNIAPPASLDGATSDKPLAGGLVADATSGSIYCGSSTNTVQLSPLNIQASTASAHASQANTISLPITGPVTVQPAGTGNGLLPLESPFVAVNQVICMQGLFPTRD